MGSLRLRIAPNAGAIVLVALAIGYAVLWAVARPEQEPTGRFVGELCGAEAVFLLSCCLVLAALIPPVERAFGGASIASPSGTSESRRLLSCSSCPTLSS
jgi:hypothetical protein